MKPFRKLPNCFDIESTKEFLKNCDLWGKRPFRGQKGSPHEQMTDIWARFRDPKTFIEKNDFTGFTDPHESVWLEEIPDVKKICYELMQIVEGGQLGGVLITKLPPGKKILPHVDSGWHAEHYDKYFVPIQNAKGAEFCFENGVAPASEGTPVWFRNDVLHWVNNYSNQDRIAMIVCIR